MTDNTYYLNMAKNVLMEIKKSVVGKDEVICKIMMAILARGHVLIEDIPGVGKTTMAHLQKHWGLNVTGYSLRLM